MFAKITESYCKEKIVDMEVLEGHLTGENNYKELFEQAKLVSQLRFIYVDKRLQMTFKDNQKPFTYLHLMLEEKKKGLGFIFIFKETN